MEQRKPTSVPLEMGPPDLATAIVRSRHAFLRDLRALLAEPRYDRWWAAYAGDERIGIAESREELLRECTRRRLRDNEFCLGCIHSQSDEETEEIDVGFAEFEEAEEIEGAMSFVEYDDDDDAFYGPAIDKVSPSP